MVRSLQQRRCFFFQEFEADLRSGELRRLGQKIPLPEKSFQLLAFLLDRPGEMVSREELHERLWPAGTHVDFDHNLSNIVATLRHALADSPRNPRYIETVGSRGYRFIAAVAAGEGSQQPSGGERHNSRKGIIRLAVLPFENFRPQSVSPDWWSDGLTEEIIVRLGHLYSRQLGVIARTSTLKYRETTKDIGQIGRELQVDYILEGSVRGLADHMCVTVQLVRVADQTHLWAERYERRLDGTLRFQNEVAESIAQTVGLQLFANEDTNPFRRCIPNQPAYLSYLKGCYHQSKRTEEDLRESLSCFERATQEDRSYAPAYSALADSLVLLGTTGFAQRPPKDFFLQAKAAALKALEINNTLAECHVTLALIKWLYEWDWLTAERLLRRAIELNPSDVHAHRLYSRYLSCNGRHEEALWEARRGCEFDPLSLSANVFLGTAHYFARQYDNALAILQNVLELQPQFLSGLIWLGAAYSRSSLYQEAISTLEKAKAHYPSSTTVWAWLGEAYAKAGMPGKACEVIDQMEALSKLRYVSALDFALVHLGLQQNDEAFQWLERAHEERSPLSAVLLPADPRFDDLRSDSRFHKLLDRMVTR